MKRVLFLGNSFTYYYDLPRTVEELSGGYLVCDSITRGGAYLNAYRTADDELRVRLDELLSGNSYDYVVLQEQSLNAVRDLSDYLRSVEYISTLVGNAKILIYQTWSYKDGSELLRGTCLSFDEMTDALESAAKNAASIVGGDVVGVGRAFSDAVKNGRSDEIYDADCLHPSEAGTALAAQVFCDYFSDKREN